MKPTESRQTKQNRYTQNNKKNSTQTSQTKRTSKEQNSFDSTMVTEMLGFLEHIVVTVEPLWNMDALKKMVSGAAIMGGYLMLRVNA